VGTRRRVAYKITLRRLEDADDEVVGGEEQAAQVPERLAFREEPDDLVPGGSRTVLELALVDAGPVALARIALAVRELGPGLLPQEPASGLSGDVLIRLVAKSTGPDLDGGSTG